MYFHRIVGFFTVECLVCRSVEPNEGTGEDGFSPEKVVELWQRVGAHINKLCLEYATDIDRYLHIIFRGRY